MKIWLLTTEFPPLSGGGISTYCYETVKMLTAEGHYVTVFTQDFSIQKRDVKPVDDRFTLVKFNPDKFYTAGFLGYEANLSFAFAETVKQYIEINGNPDVIESQEYLGIAYYLLQYKHLQYDFLKEARILVTLHSPSFLYLEYNQVIYHRLPNFWVGEMEKFCIRSADMLISPSEHLVGEIARRMDISDLVIHIVRNPYQSEGVVRGPVSQKRNAVFFGKLTPQKGCLVLIDYFQRLWDRHFDCDLILVGGGNHLYHPEGVDMSVFIRKKYKHAIKSRRLKLSGSIKPEEIDKHLFDARVVIIPSLTDNLPYTVLEAMTRGKIVLASKQGGHAEIIQNGKSGFIYDNNDPESFEAQLHYIFNQENTELEKIGSEAASAIREACSYQAVYHQKIGLLTRLLSSENSRKTFPFTRPIHLPASFQSIPHSEGDLLTVVIPYFNMGAYVEECIVSIRNSTYKQLEILLVDDGSDDPFSISILSVLQEKYAVTIIRSGNQGLARARNLGAMKASGVFLAFLDPDDCVEPSYYNKAVSLLVQYQNVHFIGCWAKYFGDSAGYWPAFTPEPPYLLFHNMVNSSALVYKKEAFLNAGLNDATMVFGMEDYESVIHLVKNGYSGVVIPEPLWKYRVRKKSMARQFTLNKQLYLYRLISQKHTDFFESYAADLSCLLNANGTGIKIDNPTLLYDVPYLGLLGERSRKKLVKTIKKLPWLRQLGIHIRKIKAG